MEPRKPNTTTTINDKVYQINKVDSRTACRLFSLCLAKADNNDLSTIWGKLSRDEFNEVQGELIPKIFLLDSTGNSTFPVAIISQGVLVGEVAEDPEVLFKLTAEALIFNLLPFLAVKESSSQK